jgi:hypothetical protein
MIIKFSPRLAVECIGHLDAERSRRLQVDDKLEFGRLLRRKIAGLGAFEDAAGTTPLRPRRRASIELLNEKEPGARRRPGSLR